MDESKGSASFNNLQRTRDPLLFPPMEISEFIRKRPRTSIDSCNSIAFQPLLTFRINFNLFKVFPFFFFTIEEGMQCQGNLTNEYKR